MPSAGGFGTSGFDNGNGTVVGFFSDPAAAYSCFRNPILGIDSTNGGGQGILRGQPFWNVDFSLKKNVIVTERFGVEFSKPSSRTCLTTFIYPILLVLGDKGDWGALGGLSGIQFTGQAQANSPRAMEFGLRLRF